MKTVQREDFLDDHDFGKQSKRGGEDAPPLTRIRFIHPATAELIYVSGKLLRLVYVYLYSAFLTF